MCACVCVSLYVCVCVCPSLIALHICSQFACKGVICRLLHLLQCLCGAAGSACHHGMILSSVPLSGQMILSRPHRLCPPPRVNTTDYPTVNQSRIFVRVGSGKQSRRGLEDHSAASHGTLSENLVMSQIRSLLWAHVSWFLLFSCNVVLMEEFPVLVRTDLLVFTRDSLEFGWERRWHTLQYLCLQ